MKLTLIRLGIIGIGYLLFKYVLHTGIDPLLLAFVTEYVLEPVVTSKV